jgi:hypothetical protein
MQHLAGFKPLARARSPPAGQFSTSAAIDFRAQNAKFWVAAQGPLADPRPAHRRVRARKLRQRRWRYVTGTADRRRREPALRPCQLRAGGLCAVRGKAPLLICSGAASRRDCLMGVQLGGKVIGAGLRGCGCGAGDWRAAAGGCHCASVMMKRRAAAAAVRPGVRPGPGSPPSSFPQVTCLGWSGRPVLPPLFACEMRACGPLPC